MKELQAEYSKRLLNGDPTDAEESIKEWMESAEAAYWKIEEGKVAYMCGDITTVPLEISDPTDFFSSTTGKGCLKIKCSELFNKLETLCGTERSSRQLTLDGASPEQVCRSGTHE